MRKLLLKLNFAAIFISLFSLQSCNKNKSNDESNSAITVEKHNGNEVFSKVMTVANLSMNADGKTADVMFLQNAQVFKVENETMLAILKDAYTKKTNVSVSFDPFEAVVVDVVLANAVETAGLNRQILTSEVGKTLNYSDIDFSTIDKAEGLSVINTTSGTLTNVIPDMATAQLMFNYITTQCCVTGAPYSVNCISFKYARDGCYARAHVMCRTLNNKYNYATHKIFSFANSGSDRLSVKANKWGGCCVTWWYHVAPLVNIKTPSGTMAYVFDPSMFNQPVLLSTWLHAQESPSCSSTPHVSMISLQPTTAYSPASYSGTSFDTDPFYYDSNSTLLSYHNRTTCP